MKIAYVSDVIYPFTKGGSEKRIYEISKRLSKKGHEIHIYGIKWWKGPKDIKFENIFLHGICKPISLYYRGKRNISEALYFSYHLFWENIKDEFDIIDCNEFPYVHYFITKLKSILYKVPLCITMHEIWNKYWFEYLGSLGIFGLLIERGVINMANNIIVVSYKTLNELKNIGAKMDRVYVVPNGVDYDYIMKILPSKNYFDIVFVGRLIKEKNVEILLKSIYILKKSISNIMVAIIGDGPEATYLKKLTKTLHIEKNVKFFGFIDNYDVLISIIKSSKIFVHPSTREGFGMVILEANACGLPVIAIKHKKGITPELINNGYNGYLIEKLSPITLANKILNIIHDENLLTIMKNNSMKVAKKYDWNTITDNIEKIYKKIII